MALRVAAALALIVGAQGSAQLQKHLRLEREGAAQPELPKSFVRALEFKHSLRVCNAYPDTSGMSVRRGEEQLTGETPMPYKSCRDFSAALLAGDKIEFKIGETTTGTFSVSDLPNSDAVLLLVIHRHDTENTAVAFDSHVFANTDAAQVAVIDAYRGAQRATPKITTHPVAVDESEQPEQAPPAPRSEQLRFDSVVAVDAGVYDVTLEAADGHEEAKTQLVARPRGSYVVLRTGVESADGQAYPEELVVFPSQRASEFENTTKHSWFARLHAFVARLWS